MKFLLKKPSVLLRYSIPIIVFLIIFIIQQLFYLQKETLVVRFIDVGQGDAVYIRAPNGNDVLIDGGPSDLFPGTLRHVMPFWDNDIDIMIATHPDSDHIKGLIPVFRDYTVRTFIHTLQKSNSSLDEALFDTSQREKNLESIVAQKNQIFILDAEKNITLEILYPETVHLSEKDTNASSIVAKLVYGDISFLFTGDAPIETEQKLIAHTSTSLKSTVLKLGHHGSKTSTSDDFLKLVQPHYAIISAGKNNRYGHPHADVMKKIQERNIISLSTQDYGTITFLTKGKDLIVR